MIKLIKTITAAVFMISLFFTFQIEAQAAEYKVPLAVISNSAYFTGNINNVVDANINTYVDAISFFSNMHIEPLEEVPAGSQIRLEITWNKLVHENDGGGAIVYVNSNTPMNSINFLSSTTTKTTHTKNISITNANGLQFIAYAHSGSGSNYRQIRIYDISVYVTNTIPLAPTNLTAMPGDRQIELNWTASTSADVAGYNIYRNNVKVNSEIVTGTSYIDTGLVNGATYTYVVRAVDAEDNDESLNSNQVQAIALDDIPPDAPTGLIATPGNAIVDLAWDANSDYDLTGYNVYRDGVKVNESLLTGTSYQDTDLINGTTYTYTITAMDTSDNESVHSAAVQAKPDTDTTPPAVPVLSVNPGNTEVQLYWTASPDEDLAGYNLYRDGAKINTNLLTGTTYLDTGLINFTTYVYTVTAVDTNDNESAHSTPVNGMPEDPDETPPAVPTGLIGTPDDAATLLTWNPNKENDLAGYNLYRDGVKVNNILLTGTSYADNGLINGQAYVYQLSAVDTTGNESGLGPQVTVTPVKSIIPKNVRAAPGMERVIVSWAPVDDATEYYVYKDGQLIGTVTDTQLIDDDVSNGVSYIYYVTALVEGTVSDPSQEAAVTAGQVIEFPDKPAGLPGIIAVLLSAFSFAGLFAPYLILILALMLVAVLISFIIWLVKKVKQPTQSIAEHRAGRELSPEEIERLKQAIKQRESAEYDRYERLTRQERVSEWDRNGREPATSESEQRTEARNYRRERIAEASRHSRTTATNVVSLTGREQREPRAERGERNGR